VFVWDKSTTLPAKQDNPRGLRGPTRTNTDRINGGHCRGGGRWIRYCGSGLRFVSRFRGNDSCSRK